MAAVNLKDIIFIFGWTVTLSCSKSQNCVSKHTAENDHAKVKKEHWSEQTYLWLQMRMCFMCCGQSREQKPQK